MFLRKYMLGVSSGGMRVALGIRRPCRMASAGVSDRKQKSEIANLKSADLKPPSNLPPAPARIPPGRLETTVGLI